MRPEEEMAQVLMGQPQIRTISGHRTAPDQDRFPIDLMRPIIRDDEGTHTELSTTVEIDGRWYNIPSIWDGRRFDPYNDRDMDFLVNKAIMEMRRGWTFPNYATRQEAERAAPIRSQMIGPLRGLE